MEHQEETHKLIQEATELALILSRPGNAGQAQKAQALLQDLQKSPAGWVIADGLLGNDEADVRHNLDKQMVIDLLVRLVDCFVHMVGRNEASVVMRKFITSMTAMFFKREAPWTYCIRHVATSLANGKYLSEEQSDQESFQNRVLPALNYDRLLAVISFSTMLAEESTRYSSTSAFHRDRLVANLNDAFFLINYSFHRAMNSVEVPVDGAISEQSRNTIQQAIESLHAWIFAMRSIRLEKSAVVSAVNAPLTCAVRFLSTPSLSGPATDLILDLLINQPTLLGAGHLSHILDFLIGPEGQQHALCTLKGDFGDDQMRFLELLLKFTSLDEQVRIFTLPSDEKEERLLFLLFKLFQAPGFAAVDDVASSLLIEFWTEIADAVNDLIIEGAFDEPTSISKANFSRVIDECFDKLIFPDAETLSDWEDDDVKLFNAFRRDFSDFLLATYPILGVPVIQQIQERAATAISNQDWARFEVAMFCLASLAESVAENKHADDLLHALFQSEIFRTICCDPTSIPLKPRQTLSDLIARYTVYFERNHGLLPPVLNFLFTSMESPSCEQAAAKSVAILCSTCRNSLIPYIGEFLDKYYQLQTHTSTSNHALERVVEGISSVIQALDSDPKKVEYLIKLLDPLCQEASAACEMARNGQLEVGLAKGIGVMGCTASIGRGLRAPDDLVIDIDGETNGDVKKANFWSTDPCGLAPQSRIVSILKQLMNEFCADGDIIEGVCNVLKAGYTEQSPGPFVLPPQVTVHFVKAVSMASPRFPVVMGTASAFLASQTSIPSQIHNDVVDLILHVYHLMSQMAQDAEKYDPEASSCCIDFLTRLLPKYSDIFFSLTGGDPSEAPLVVSTVLHFTLFTLRGPDTLPLRASCAFWAALLSLPKLPSTFIPSSQLQGRDGGASPSLFDAFLSQLAEVVIYQIAGRCARSELDHFSEIIKKFVFKHQAAAKIHLGNALTSMCAVPAIPQPENLNAKPAMSAAAQDRVLSSILLLRGARSTNTVVKEYWVACRGKGFAYT
ncbi:member of the karyopherin-beta [Ophidiomyces ophidiicola]|nr:member of the karyopherin-beta [Ophidiomyces ophidiicola]KAI2018079.1 member of the karyopherin-beta [Ophidiomyces ophidiicola]KAI2134297.1 member of the karyopherin-beta [Ophidiomyces ophidiicola]KAI2136699.1 member of the karyopherin-beta [Ophidiomyces ophidiicola]KAI2218817.1 member of the karyopherin-beta [Ophidiomyces ophidiicola]